MLKAIDKNAILKPGQKIMLSIIPRITFSERFNAYLLAANIAKAEKDGYVVDKWQYRNDGGIDLYLTMSDQAGTQIVNAGVVTPAVIVAAIIGFTAVVFSVSAYLITDEIADNPGLQDTAKTISVSIVLSILAGLAGLYFLKVKR